MAGNWFSFWENEMVRLGYDKVMTSSQANESAQHFYRKLGYQDAGSFFPFCNDLEIIFTKELVCARKCDIEGSFMDIEIKKLSPEMAEDYVHFFDVTPHDDNIDENKCYCVCWCSDDHSGDVDLSTANKRRELAKQYVKHGIIQGYAAYYGDRMVGWCNANTKSECVNCCSWLNFMQEVDVPDAEKVKSVFCFLIAPDMRGKGVAAMLLDKVCADAKADGFDYIEAYPRKSEMSGKANEYSNFQGPYKMFEQAGFAEYRKLRDKVVVRKYLK